MSEPDSTDAEAVLAMWLADHDADDTTALEELCRRYPKIGVALRTCASDLLLATAALRQDADALRAEISASAQLDAATSVAIDDLLADDVTGPALAGLAERGVTPGRYDRGELIGVGGAGDVRFAKDCVLGRSVALKTMRPSGVTPQGGGLWRRERVLRFRREMEILARLEHPNIVGVFDVGIDEDGRPFLVMPFIAGRDLGEVIAAARAGHGGWTLVRTVLLFEQVCNALVAAHAAGVVHRDVKPANVRIGAYGEVSVLDWGLAKSLDASEGSTAGEMGGGTADDAPQHVSPDVTRDGSALGTPAYMAPEQARHSGQDVGPQADVYAVGAMLFELLSGHPPSLGERLFPNGAWIAGSRADELASIAVAALREDPLARYADMSALRDDLRAWIEGRVVAAHPTGPWQTARKWSRRNRRVTLLCGLLVVGVIVAGFVLVSSSVRVREARDEAESRLVAYEQLADITRAERLIDEAEHLAPEFARGAEETRAWLSRAEQLLGVRAERAASAEGLADDARRDDGRLVFSNADVRFRYERLVELDGHFDALTGVRDSVSRRFARSDRIAEAARDPAWESVRSRVRVRYGIDMSPQEGLLPIGVDPASGLETFVHLLSGDAPGDVVDVANDGVVLILVPGGTARIGSQNADPTAEHYDAQSTSWERPVHKVDITPFFLAKTELSQAQWERMAPWNPSHHRSEGAARLPVEQVTWTAAHRVLGRHGLRLPLEREWEYAARAGSGDPHPFPVERLAEFGNVKDIANVRARTGRVQRVVTASGAVMDESGTLYEPVDDGAKHTAPVGSYRPNPWGFHDFVGNVMEWCADEFVPYPGHPEGTTIPGHDGKRVFRGGAFHRALPTARVANRHAEVPDFHFRSVGVRPARSLDVVDR